MRYPGNRSRSGGIGRKGVEPPHHGVDEVVRGGRPRGQPNRQRPARRQPTGGDDLRLEPDRPMSNLEMRGETGRIRDVICRQLGGADAGEIGRIAAVVATHDDHQVERFLLQQVDDGILPVLGRTANRVERAEPGAHFLNTVTILHGRAETLADLQRF